MKSRVYAAIETDASTGKGSKRPHAFNVFIIALILLNIAAVMISSVASVEKRYSGLFRLFEIFSVVVFSIEYALRIWICTENPKYRHPLWGRLRFAVSPMAIIDLAAVFPFYVPMLIRADLRFLRVLRLFRLFRVLKLGRYSRSLRLVGDVVSSRRGELAVTVFLILILLILSSSLLYFAEVDVQPEKFSSIPASLWWGVVTLTTVGYGDVIPMTPVGKIISSIISFLGVGLFALPAGILGAGFLEEIRKNKSPKERTCPHCGKSLD
ncbi:MAG: ion transporter [Candidatus Aminicenantes bacterium]|nr:ion transporter [Candidatus Aminicenantes bacterium]